MEGLGVSCTVWKNVLTAQTEGPAEASAMFMGSLRGGISGVCPQFVVGLVWLWLQGSVWGTGGSRAAQKKP